eukprot:g1879.t1
MPESYPTYPSRKQFASYLEAYSTVMCKDVRCLHVVKHAQRLGEVDGACEGWIVQVLDYSGGNASIPIERVFYSKHLVVCTGIYGKPILPPVSLTKSTKNATPLVLHSSKYTNATDLRLKGKRVLVVGGGNSAFEIILDLLEHGAIPSLLVRSPQVVVPRWAMKKWQSFLYTHFRWARNIPFAWLALPAFMLATELGFEAAATWEWGTSSKRAAQGIVSHRLGVIRRLFQEQRPPTIDVGTMKRIMKGDCPVISSEIQCWLNDGCGKPGCVFKDGTSGHFDAVIFATGYEFFSAHANFLDEATLQKVGYGKKALVSGQAGIGARGGETSVSGLHFCFLNLKQIRDSAGSVVGKICRHLHHKKDIDKKKKSIWMNTILPHAGVIAGAILSRL